MKYARLFPCALILALLLTACGHNVASSVEPDRKPLPIEKPALKLKPEVDRRAESIYQAHPELTPVNYDSPVLLPASDDAGEKYLDRITFLCDSPTYWLKPFGMLRGGTCTTQIWTGSEGTMTLAYLRGFRILDPYDRVERTIPETMARHQPAIMVIALGINGISFMDEADFIREYSHLVEELQAASPDTQLILQAMYPISPSFRYWGDITNASVTRGNAWILRIAEEYGLPYLDTFAALLGEDGNARPELMMDDGLHPNQEGLTRVLEYIRTHAWQPPPDEDDPRYIRPETK
ncbi:MAG: SGNH/GDSL hydrolase family protein [Oscillospiraceae bacterium]|nr:SGNH/GDSL hydrolase family protein [Oscillospiraceae bacterium]